MRASTTSTSTQPWQTADEAVLFLTSVFGLSAGAPAEVPGPTGLVRSQVMHNADQLGAAAAQRRPAHPRRRRPAPAHRVRLRSTSSRWPAPRRATGLAFLPVPDNYDYLTGRFGWTR